MGSGLILLVIVGAWLAVLVPMGLRSRDHATTLRGAERFSDAMRVLSRRPTGNERTSLVPRRPPGSRTVLSAGRTPPQERLVATPSFLERYDSPDGDPFADERAPLSLAARRRRVLLVLVFLAFTTGILGLAGVPLIRLLCTLVVLFVVGFVAHCRRQAVLAAEQGRLRAVRQRVEGRRTGSAAAAASAVAPRITGIPRRMPARPAPLAAPLPAPAARYDEPLVGASTAGSSAASARFAAGSDWQPVPVPLPTYVGKAAAPPRPRTILDLTRPGEWSAALEAEDGVLSELEDGKDLDVILERRRAVGGW